MTLARSVLALAVLLVSSAAIGQTSPPAQSPTMRVAFRGELVDEESRPISGVFPLTFKLYRSATSEAPVWEERQYVAVFDGMYEVHLGRTEGIPSGWQGEERVLEVAIEDVVVGSQTLMLHRWVPHDQRGPTIRYERLVELAGTGVAADEAQFARDCRTLEGQPVAAVDHYGELRSELDELRERLNGPAGNRIGTETVVLSRIGGEGGIEYEYNCPPGFVMTGARGGAGQVIDGFRIICTQLQ